jgi:hypothetical protein
LQQYFYKIDIGYLNPFLNYWQTALTRSFEGGLHQVWSIYYQTLFGSPKNEKGNEILTFNDLLPVFLILPIGFGLAIIAEFGQIFFDRYLRRFVCRKVRPKVSWSQQKLRVTQQPKIRRIRVQPIERDEVTFGYLP